MQTKRLSLEAKLDYLSNKSVKFCISKGETEGAEKHILIVTDGPYPGAFYFSKNIRTVIQKLYNDIKNEKKPEIITTSKAEELGKIVTSYKK